MFFRCFNKSAICCNLSKSFYRFRPQKTVPRSTKFSLLLIKICLYTKHLLLKINLHEKQAYNKLVQFSDLA